MLQSEQCALVIGEREGRDRQGHVLAVKTREDGAEAVFPAAEHGGNMVAGKIVITGPQPANCGGHVGRPVGWGDEQGGRLFRRWRVGGGRVMGDRAERVEERGGDIGGWGREFEPFQNSSSSHSSSVSDSGSASSCGLVAVGLVK